MQTEQETENVRTIESDKIARVEGNGKIQITINDGSIDSVLVNIYEGPRLVEELVMGKTIDEVISIVPRICAICNLSHKLATVTAMQNATKTHPPEHTSVFHHLMHMGEMIESHALHIYLLVLPDIFRVNNAVELLDSHAETVVEGLTLKKFGNKIMFLAGGNRGIHGENPKVGGFGKYPSIETLKELKEEAEELLPLAIKIVDTLGGLNLPSYPNEETIFVCVDPPNDEFGFYGDYILSSTGMRVHHNEYTKIFEERVVPHSFAKRALHQNKPFTVGSIARVILLGDRLKGMAGELFEKYYSEEWKTNPLYNNMAQAIELVYSLEQVKTYIDELIELLSEVPDIPIMPPTRLSGRGVGSVEAPRGLLIHDYNIMKGTLTRANIVTPTALNLDDIERHLLIGGQELLKQNLTDEELQFNLEMLTRAYDPCISCSAHLVEIKH